MKRKTIALIFAFVLTAVTAAGVGVYAGSGYGTESDPLVTLSYLDKVLTPNLMGQFQEKLSDEVTELKDSMEGGGTGSSYSVLTLEQGQGIVCDTGCEVLMRQGSVKYVGGASGLIDSTGGGTQASGASLAQNHLYMVTSDGGGFLAQSSGTMLLVRGPYTIA
ncbi:MAG: hypothetical protein Q4A39_01365 [Eubacteriales bacterium]|nr:hypothetical protein [Eubacteriales bacterium]